MGLEAARLTFEPEFYESHNQSWLREDANLSLLFVSDEDDVSPYPVNDYLRYFSNLKGDRAYREEGVLNLSAVVGVERPPRDDYPSCETESGFGWYGARYLKAATETGGLVESICAEDFAPIISELGLTLSGLEVDFYLSGIPDLGTSLSPCTRPTKMIRSFAISFETWTTPTMSMGIIFILMRPRFRQVTTILWQSMCSCQTPRPMQRSRRRQNEADDAFIVALFLFLLTACNRTGGSECNAETSCGFGETCVNGFCESAECNTSTECPMESYCNAGRTCVSGM